PGRPSAMRTSPARHARPRRVSPRIGDIGCNLLLKASGRGGPAGGEVAAFAAPKQHEGKHWSSLAVSAGAAVSSTLMSRIATAGHDPCLLTARALARVLRQRKLSA